MKFRLLILLSCVAIGVNAEEIQPPKTSDTQPQKQQSQVEKTTPVEASESTDELPADLQALLASNPFGSPVKKQQQDTQKPENNFALTGISFVDGKWLFSVVDYAERTVYTLKLNGKISDELPFRVDFFDEETQLLIVYGNGNVANYEYYMVSTYYHSYAPWDSVKNTINN